MAQKQTIIWTALPNGMANGQLKLSVFVSPRLQTDQGLPHPTLTQFSDFLSWPTKIQSMKFQVQFEGLAPVDATRVGPAPEPDLWGALFKETTYVEPYQFHDYTNRQVLSHPVLHVDTFVKSQYQSVAATSPTRLPSRTHILERLAPISLYAVPRTSSSTSRPEAVMTRGYVGTASTAPSQSAGTAQAARPMQRQVVIPEHLTNFIRTLHPNLQPKANRDLQMLVREPFPLKASTESAFQSVYKDLQQYKSVRMTPQLQPERDFLLVRMFKPELPETIEPLQPPEIDFHKMVSSLGSYPEIIKALGLVINLEVPLPPGLGTSSTVRIIPQWSPDSPPASFSSDFSPKTAYVLDSSKSRFAARPEKPDSDIIDGLLKLNDHQSFPIVNVDVDGSALKMINLADRLVSSAMVESEKPAAGTMHPMMLRMTPKNGGGQTPSAPAPSEQVEGGTQTVEPQALVGLPALRTGSLSVSKTGKAEWLVNKFSRATLNNQAVQNNTPDQVTLYAEDVVRGYRVDVWDSESKTWHSLCQRKGSYNFFEANLMRQYDDEGFVQLAATQSAVESTSTPETPQDLYLDEAMFSWNGWSLCAPRPGKTISPEGIPMRLDDPQQAQQRAQSEFKMVASFVPAPGSLPKLRFGVTYRVRARVVDLAGNSLTSDAPNPSEFSKATDPHPYNRFEPVVAPLAVLTKSLVGSKSPGEALYRPVIRSNFDKSAEEYAPSYGSLVSDPQYTAFTLRLIAPPKTSELMAERHGMFDLASGEMKKDQATYQMMVNKADADFPMDPMTRLPVQNKVELPYLPDPLSRGISMVLLDAKGKVAGTVPAINFYPSGADWPEGRPFFVKVVEGKNKTLWNWDEASRTLTVQLPKAEVAKFELSSYLGDGQLGSRNQSLLGVWDWVQQANPSNLMEIRTAVVQGRFWMVTPSRELLLVHAVQQPLIAPLFHHLSPNRHTGETFAYIVDDQAMPIDGKSTLKVDIAANWQEMIDDINDPTGPHERPGNAHVHTWDINRENIEITQPLQRYVTGSIINQEQTGQTSVTTSQKSQMIRMVPTTEKIQTQEQAQTPSGQTTMTRSEYKLQAGTQIPNDVRLFRPPEYHVGLEKFGYSWRHDFGDTKYRKISYQAVATTRFKEYFPITDPEQLTRKSPAVNVDVPNSARPAQPNVLYVLPTFGWDRKEDVRFDHNTSPTIAPTALSGLKGVGTTSRRVGGGLRIYLDRPWFSSGDGELLGVVIWPSVLQAKSSGMVVGAGSVPSQYHPVQSSSGQSRSSKTKLRSMLKFEIKKNFELPEALKPLITQWGIDPIWASNPLPADLPKFENFTNPAQIGMNLTLQELEGMQDPSASYYNVGVAAYKPEYDKDRQLWYCDVEIDAGNTYFPFIRLALVRYQPISVANAHLSRVVLADLAQLTPDRTAMMVYNPKNPKKIDLVVAGLSYSARSAGKGPSLVEATVETNPAGADNQLGWVPVPNGTVVLEPNLIGQQTVWKYQLHLGKLKVPKLQALRLVIKEFEVLDADRRTEPGQILFATGQPMTGRRLIYAEILKVPPIS
jgi:hypothetical protein